MTIVIGDNSPRKTYTGNGSTTEFATDFAFFDKADVNVYVDGVLKTLNTDYTIPTTGANAWSTGNDGTVVFTTAPANNTSVVLTRDVELERTTDFPTSGPFQVGSLNTELDKIIAMIADMKDLAERGLRLADSDTGAALQLEDKNARKGTVLAFNATTGAVEVGPTIADTQSIADIKADIAALADIEDGTVATDAISDLAAIASDVTTVAGVASNVTTVAGQTTNMQNVTDNLSAIQNAATNATTASTKATEAATSATNAATSATAASTAQTAAETAKTAAETAQTAAETAETNAETAETNAETAQTAAETAQTAAETAETNAATSETNAATSASTATTKATEAATSATNAATSETNAATSATNAATSATAAAASQTAAAASASAAAASFDSFDDRYLGVKASDPTTDNDGDALAEGMLYFSSSDNEMKVYDGANWIAASSAGSASLLNYNYTATGGQTTFSGADDNSATLSYTSSNIIVTLNGVVLEDGTDYTASNGTSVVLTDAASADDELNIVAFKSFTTADMVSAATGGTFNGDVTVNSQLTINTGDEDHILLENGSESANIQLRDSGNMEIIYKGSGNKLKFMHDSTERMRIDDSGKVGIGTSSPSAGSIGGKVVHVQSSGETASVRVDRSDASTAGTLSVTSGNGSNGLYGTGSKPMTFSTNSTERMRLSSVGDLHFNSTTRSGSYSNTTSRWHLTRNGDDAYLWHCADQGSTANVYLQRIADGSFISFGSGTSYCGSIGTKYSTTYFAGASSTSGVLFNSNGIIPTNSSGTATDNTYDLGQSTARWDDVRATNGTIQTSDQNEKQQIASLTASEITAAKAISKLFKTFKWNDSVTAKGDNARTHTGVIAQNVQQAMTDAGLDAGDYAFFISDTWWETSTAVAAVAAVAEVLDADGNVVTEAVEAQDAYTRVDTYDTQADAPASATQRTRLGIRYPELLAFVGAASEQRMADLETKTTDFETRIAALEAN